MPYDERKLLILVCVAIYKEGSTFFHVMSDISDNLMDYASCASSPAECNYSQTKNGGGAVVYCVRKFHSYLDVENLPS